MIAQGNNMAQLGILSNPNTVVVPATVPSPLQPVSDALSRVFVSDQEQTRIQKARSIMGDSVSDLSDEELEAYVTEFQYLIDEWLNEFEQQAFDGQTLRQVLAQE